MHRNWKAVVQHPLDSWYQRAESIWTLDYPPFFAYFEWFLSLFAPLFDSKTLDINALEYVSQNSKLYMRLTVMMTEIVFYLSIK